MAKARNLSVGKKLLFTAMAVPLVCLAVYLLLGVIVGAGVAIESAAKIASAAKGSGLSNLPPSEAMNINIVSIGGMNVWAFIVFWLLSQCILVHHARRGSKQQG